MLPALSTVYYEVQTLRAAAILPAAGAWDATPIVAPVPSINKAVLYLAYTRGGAAGSFDFQLQVSPYSADQPTTSWFDQSLYSPEVLVPGADAISEMQREFIRYLAVGAAEETIVYGPVQLLGVERLRVRGREVGNVAAPGDLFILGVFSERI